MLTETSEFLKKVFDDETGGIYVQKKILEYESKKMQELIKDWHSSKEFKADEVNYGVWDVIKKLYKV